jgi:hypothetical protein
MKVTLNYLNEILKPYGAKVSTENSILQSKAIGCAGWRFKGDKRPVYSFDVVSIKTNISFANIDSDIYKKIPFDVKQHVLFQGLYFETNKRIYV